MKTLRIITLLACLLVGWTLRAQTPITLDVQDASLGSVLKSISAQTNYKFAYNSKNVDVSRPVTVRFESTDIRQVLDRVLEDSGIGYTIVGQQIALFKKTEQQPARRYTVTGTVTDDGGSPLPGAGLQVVGTDKGTFTDADGRFSLEVSSPEDRIAVTYIGMDDTAVYAGSGRPLVIIMKPNYEFLNQVVVTGYQTLSKERSAGSFATVKGAEVQNRANAAGSPLKGLEGTVAGLNVQASSEGTTYLIRGMSSINAKTEPLYIVDGVPMSRDLLEKMVSPGSIESVTFLKDATAASIWGAQAANGVVVFTTRSGSVSAKPSVTYNGTFTYRGKPDWTYQDRMDSARFIDTAREVFDPYTYSWSDISNTTYGGTANYPIVYPHEDALYRYYLGEISLDERDARLRALAASQRQDSYEKYLMSNAWLTTHSLSLSGGSDQHTYFLSFDFQGNQGTARDNSQEYKVYLRDILRLGDWLRLDASLGAMRARNVQHLTASDEFSHYETDLPYAAFTDADGNFRDMSGYFISPAMLEKVRNLGGIDLGYYPVQDYLNCQTQSGQFAVRGNLGLTIDITPWLTYEGRFQYSLTGNDSESYYPQDSFMVRVERAYALGPDGKGYLPSSGGRFTDSHISTSAYTVRNQLSFNKDFGEKHTLTALAGFEFNADKTATKSTFVRGYDRQTMQYIFYDDYFLYTTGVKNPLLPMLSGATANTFEPNAFTQGETEYRFVSMYANAGYTLLDRYSLNASVRVDQSNLFGSDPSVQFKPIWSVGAIWNMKKEAWMQDFSWLDRLNLRLSWGLAGNSPNPGQGGPYNLISSVSDPAFARFGLGYTIQTPANNKLTWERTRTWNVGVDFTAFSGRLDVTLDVYDKYTTNLLTAVPVDPTTGFTSVLSNIGEMSNRGFELAVNGTLLQTRDLRWDAFSNLTWNRNRLVSMYITPPDTPSALIGYSYWEGYPYGTLFGYRWAGLDPTNGRSRVYNENGDIVSTVSDVKDASAVPYLGTTIPPWFGSLGTSLSWRGLTLSVLFIYNLGHRLRNDVNTQYTYRLTGGLHNDFAQRWKTPGDESRTDVPAYFPLSDTSVSESDVTALYRYADINVLSASYLKLRDLSLRYTLPETFVRKLGPRSVTVGLQVSDLLTLAANGQGIDPEAFYLSGGSRGDRFRPAFTANLNIEF